VVSLHGLPHQFIAMMKEIAKYGMVCPSPHAHTSFLILKKYYNRFNGGCFSAAMVTVTKAMCWTVVAKTLDSSGIGLVIYQKPTSSSCYQERKENTPPLCEYSDKKSISSWYIFSPNLFSLQYQHQWKPNE